jgi:hypothetical protein
MEVSSVGKREYGGKGRWVKYWACLGCWISPCYGPFSLGGLFESYQPFISLIFNFFSSRVFSRLNETADYEPVCTAAILWITVKCVKSINLYTSLAYECRCTSPFGFVHHKFLMDCRGSVNKMEQRQFCPWVPGRPFVNLGQPYFVSLHWTNFPIFVLVQLRTTSNRRRRHVNHMHQVCRRLNAII